jgi:drug/metabolite transporter (DMT)-like permease
MGQLYGMAIMAAVSFALAFGFWFWAARRLLPELESRAGEMPAADTPRQRSSVAAFRHRRSLSSWGVVCVCLGMLVAVLATSAGALLVRDEDTLLLLGIAAAAPLLLIGMVLVFRGAQGPGCDNLLHYRYHRAADCPYCGTRLNE